VRERLDGVSRRGTVAVAGQSAAGPSNHERSISQAHLDTTYFDTRMQPRGTFENQIHEEYREGRPDAKTQPHKDLLQAAIGREAQHADTHVAFYHAQPPEMRIAQDVYKRLYEKQNGVQVSEDFHFMRFPGPDGSEFKQYEHVNTFVEAAMQKQGLINDHTTEVRANVVAANLALHGNFGHPGEETFGYFWRGESPFLSSTGRAIGRNTIHPEVERHMESYHEKFGFPTNGLQRFLEQAGKLNQTSEGSILQVLVPKERVDELAYLSHAHGLPRDDQALKELHRYGSVEYGTIVGRRLEREPLGDELDRKLKAINENWGKEPATAREKLDAQLVNDLREQTLKKLHDGAFRPSRVVDELSSNPDSLRRRSQADRYAGRVAKNPEHFSGRGIESPDEVNQIRNPSNAIQARLLMSARPGGTLDPRSESGIIVARHTTRTPEQTRKYEELVDRYVGFLEKARVVSVEGAVKAHKEKTGVSLPDPKQVQPWDGKQREGTLLQVSDQVFAMHTGRDSYMTLPPRLADNLRQHAGQYVQMNSQGQVRARAPLSRTR
jgi:hypothetical protein